MWQINNSITAEIRQFSFEFTRVTESRPGNLATKWTESSIDQERRLDFKGPFPVRNAAIHPKGEQPKALYPRVLPFILFLSLAGAALGTRALIALRTLIHKPRAGLIVFISHLR